MARKVGGRGRFRWRLDGGENVVSNWKVNCIARVIEGYNSVGDFRRLIISVTETILVFGTIIGTIFALVFGYVAMTSNPLFGALLGGMAGFAIFGASGSVLFLLMEIAEQSKISADASRRLALAAEQFLNTLPTANWSQKDGSTSANRHDIPRDSDARYPSSPPESHPSRDSLEYGPDSRPTDRPQDFPNSNEIHVMVVRAERDGFVVEVKSDKILFTKPGRGQRICHNIAELRRFVRLSKIPPLPSSPP